MNNILFVTLLKSQYVKHIGKVEMCIELEGIEDDDSECNRDDGFGDVWWW